MGKYFGTDGVRGVAGADLTCEMAMLIGRGAAAVLTSSTGHKPRILIGKDTREVDILGHSVAMHTLTVEESLKAALIAKEYAGSGGSILATKTAMLAAAIDAIDAETLYAPAKINENEIYGKYKALVTGYYPTFIGECYEEYSKMEREQAEKVDRLKKSRA